ncbi:MAG: hypothetical protein PVF87_09630, partial [Acidimicrobiia bacterium]
MELRRLAKALSERWVLIVVLAALGVAAALVFGTIANRNQTSRFEATASIRFVPPEGGEIATLADEIAAAQSIASLAATDLLENQPNSRIVEDLANQRLNFVAQGSSREDATERAGALLQAYLSVDPEAGIPVEQLMAEIEAEAAETQARIDSMQASPTEEAQQLAASIAFIDEQIAAIQQRLVSLVVEEAAADAAGRSAIAAQRNYLTTQLNALQEEKAALGVVPEPELSTQDTLMLAALQARLDSLTAEYQRLYLRQSGVASEGSGIEPTVVVDLTPAPIRPIVSASIGLLGGLLIAVLATLFLNRTRRPVWLAEDVEIPLLGEVPPRPVTADTSENWYDGAEPGQRKTSIQAIRGTIEAQVSTSGATIGLTSHSVAAEDVQAFAADLASSLASAGTSVLLVDANFDSRSPLGQYKVGGASVAGVLELNPSAPEFGAQVRYIAESAFRIRSGLSVIPSGPPPANPADSLAGRAFRHLIADAQDIYDVVVVVVDEVDSPSAQVALQRLGYGILVLTPGKSTIPEVEGVLRDM